MDKNSLQLYGKQFVSFLQRLLYRRILGPVFVIGVAMVIFYGMVLTAPEPAPSEVKENSWPVSVIPVDYQDVQPVIRVYGEVVARRAVDIQPLVGGQILEVWDDFKEGGLVRHGDPLVRIDTFQYEASVREAQAALEEGRARLEESESRYAQEKDLLTSDRERLELHTRNLARSDKLAQQGYVSEKAVDDRKLSVAQMGQTVRSREHALEINQGRMEQQKAINVRLESALRRAQRNLDNTLVTAPFTGLLERVSGGAGQNVSPNTRLARLIDAESLEVRFTLAGNQLRSLVEGNKGDIKGREVDITWRLGDRLLLFKAHVDRIGARVDTTVGGIDVYAVVEMSDQDIFLRSGAFVEVTFRSEMLRDVMTLPEDAVFDNGTVYIIDEDNRLEAREVTVVGQQSDQVFVRGDLKPAERVLITRFPEAGAGVLVRIL